VIFTQYIPKKRKRFGIKIFKLCDATGYTYDIKVYLGKDRQRTAQHVTATHARVTELKRKTEGRGHKLYKDNFFSSPELFNDLVTKQIYCCGTVRPNKKGMPQDLKPKTKKLKRGDIRVRIRADLTAIL
jgi:ribosomal protein L1